MAGQQNSSNGYGKRPLWHWILLYISIGAVIYGLVYYFVFAKKGTYTTSQQPTSTETAPNQTAPKSNGY